jgi:pectin methylesterase-like acyl-CoA thioesterase
LSNNIALVVEANGNAIEKAENGIKTEDGVAFKVQVKSNLDVVTVEGGEDFAYTIGGKAVKKAKTSYTAKDDDVKNGYVTIINNGGNLLSINVVQKEAPKPLDPPTLDSLIVNGTKFAADSLFGNAIKGQLVLDFDEPMVSEKNPVSTVVKAGQVDLITYTGDDTKCTVVIEMSNGDQTVKYTLDITQKPSVVLTYYDSDGITVLGKSRREKGKTIEHFDFGADDVTVEEGFKMRGWYHEPEGGLKYTLEEKVVEDISLYAMTTIIEEVSNSAIYNFDLTDIYFDPNNHEAFNPKGEGFYWYDDVHGWAFKNDNQIDLLVGPRATISLKLCQENYAKDSIIVISQAGDTLSILSPKVEEDGDLVNYLYEGEGGTLTLKIKTSGEVTIHSVRIMNTAEANYVNVGNWYIVNPDDGKSFLDVIRIANSLNTTKNAERIYVFLPKGTYDLGNTVEATISAYNVSIIGQSADSTIIVTTPDYEVEGLGTSDLIKNTSSNLYLQDLTLKNAFDYYNNRSQGAAAVLNDQGDHTIGKNVRMLSHESTYYCMNNRTQSYWEDCDIHGVFDFICGGGDIRIQKSTLSLEPRFTNGGGTRVIVTPRTLTKFGYVFDNCKVVDLADGKGEWSFGRTWSNQPIAVYLNTTLDEYAENTLVSTRWTEEGRTATDPLVFGEFNTMDINGIVINPETNTIKIKSSFQTILTASQAAEFSYEKMFSSNTEKKWDPAKLTEQVAAPTDANYANGSVTWSAVDGATMYALFMNDKFITLTDETSYNIEVNPDLYRLSIRSANAMGGFGPEGHVAGTTGIQTVKKAMGDDVIYNLQGVRVKNPGKGIYIINGKKTILK